MFFYLLGIEMREVPYYASYSPFRLFVYNLCMSKYFDLAIAGVIGVNVATMSMEFYKMPQVNVLRKN